FTSYPNLRPLLYAIAIGILSSGAKHPKELIAQLPPSSFDWEIGDAPCTSAGVAVLRILRSRRVGKEEIIALTSEPTLNVRLSLVNGLSENEYFRNENEWESAEFLVKLREGLGSRVSEVAPWLYKPLKRALDARKSGISDRAIWIEALRLPEDAYS